MFKKSSFDHEVHQVAYPTSNLEFRRAFRCSSRFCLRSAPQSLLHPTFSVLKSRLFEHILKRIMRAVRKVELIKVHHDKSLSGEEIEQILEHLEAELEQIKDRNSEG